MRFVIDIESSDLLGNGLDYSTMPYRLKDTYKVHCVVIRHVDSGKVKSLYGEELTKENLRKTLEKCTELIGHNIVNFDLPVLSLYGLLDYSINYPDAESTGTVFGKNIKITDTLIWSKMLNADRFGGHSLDAWGKRLGNYKGDFSDWSKFSEQMLEYCIQDTAVNVSIFNALKEEQGDHDWSRPYSMEIKLVDLTLKQELFGFAFDSGLAQKALEDLTSKMQEIAAKVNPLLPKKKLSKTDAARFIPPKIKFKKDGTISAVFKNFLERTGAVLTQENKILMNGVEFPVTTTEPIFNEEESTIEDIDVVKGYLLSLGWVPSEVKERDIAKNADKTVKNLQQIIEAVDRYVDQTKNSVFKELRLDLLDTTEERLRSTLMKLVEEAKPQIRFNKMQAQKPIFLPTTPKLTVGVEKEICPNLVALGDKADFVKDVVQYYTYRHRKNSIAGGSLNEDGEPETGFVSAVRPDGRIPTPADTLGANTGRYRHRIVCNIPRVTSLYGEPMRALFGSGKGLWQLGYDFASLEARIMGHYVIPYKDGKALAESLVAEKPNDIHSLNAKKLGIDRSAAKSFSYACLPMQTKVLTKQGWKLFSDIMVGEELPTFNSESGLVEMDIVQMKHYFTDKQVFRYSNKQSAFECTEDHRWYGWRRSKSRSGSKKLNGYFQASDFTQEHNILLAAPYVGGDSKVTPDEAEFIGFLLSDGSITWSKKSLRTSAVGGKKKGVRVQLNQSMNKFHNEIRNLLIRLNLPHLESLLEVDNGNNIYHWVVSQPAAREFLDRVVGSRTDKHETDWTSWVLSLSRESLEAFYRGFYNGDGDLAGHKELITQNVGRVHDAIVTAAQLLGKGRIKFQKHSGTNKECKGILIGKKKHMTMQEVKKQDLGVQDTFCLTTKNSSFIIWQDDFVGITGNCIYGEQPKKLAKMLGVNEFRAKELFNAYWEAVPALKELKEAVEKQWEALGKKHIKGIDGRLLSTRSKHSLINVLFQSGGAISAKWSAVRLAQYLEDRGLLGDPLRDNLQDQKVWFMICMHDEQQLAVHPKLMNVKPFGSEEAAKEALAEGCSAIGHGSKGCYVGFKTEPVKAIEYGIKQACKELKLNVDLGFEWIPGLTWAQCH